MIELQQNISRKKKKRKIHRTVDVLVEDVSKKEKGELLGRTEYNEMVVFPGNAMKIGTFSKIKLESLQGNTYKGKEILCPGN